MMDDPRKRQEVPRSRSQNGLKDGIEAVSGLVSDLWKAALTYDQYSPGDEFRLDHRSGLFFYLVENIHFCEST